MVSRDSKSPSSPSPMAMGGDATLPGPVHCERSLPAGHTVPTYGVGGSEAPTLGPDSVPSVLGPSAAGQAGFGSTRVGSDVLALHEEIGVGGMSRIYRGWQTSLERDVAVKVVRDDIPNPHTARDMMLAEARITARLEHPGVPSIHELRWSAEGEPLLAMRRLHGETWSRRAASLSRRENASIVMRVAQVIAYAHSHGIIHRDLKPGNVMIGDFGEVLLLDWGMALELTEVERHAARWFGIPTGTPQYMAPEAAKGQRPDVRTDVYGLGGLLYFAIHHYPPHPDADPAAAIRHASEGVVEILGDPTSDDLLAVALTALSYAPNDRFATVTDFITALQQAFAREEARRLLLDAEEDMGEASNLGYERFQRAIFRFREAQRYWPENAHIVQRIDKALRAYAQYACEHGDLDLAEGLLDGRQPSHQRLLTIITHQRRRREWDQADAERHAQRLLQEQERTYFVQRFLLDVLREAAYERQGPEVTLISALAHSTAQAQQQLPGDPLSRAYVRQVIINTLQGKQFTSLRESQVELFAREVEAAGVDDQHELARSLCYERALLLRDQEQYREALVLVRELLYLVLAYEPEFGQEHAQAYELYMECALGVGAIDEVREVAEQTLLPALRELPKESSWRRRIEPHLFGYLVRIGALQEAEKTGWDVLETARLDSMDDPKTVLHPLMNLVFLLMDQGRWEEAETVMTEAYELRSQVYGSTSPPALAARGLLGAIAMGRGDLQLAGQQLLDVLDALRNNSHLRPRDYFEPLLRVGRWYQRQGEIDAAREIIAEAEGILPTCSAEARQWLAPLLALLQSWCHQDQQSWRLAVSCSWQACRDLEGHLGHGDGRARRARVAWAVQWRQWQAIDAEAADAWLAEQQPEDLAQRAVADAKAFPGLANA